MAGYMYLRAPADTYDTFTLMSTNSIIEYVNLLIKVLNLFTKTPHPKPAVLDHVKVIIIERAVRLYTVFILHSPVCTLHSPVCAVFFFSK